MNRKIPCDNCICLAICKARILQDKSISRVRENCYLLDEFIYKIDGFHEIKCRSDHLLITKEFFGL